MRSTLALAGAATVVAAAVVVAPSTPAQAANTLTVAAGSASWGYKQSFRTYIGEELGRILSSSAPQARASIRVTNGATFVGNEPSNRKPVVNKAPYKFVATGGSLDSTGKGKVRFGGAVSYAYPNHYIQQMRYSNITLVLDGRGKGGLYADIKLGLHNGQAGETPINTTRSQVHLAALTNAKANVSGTTATLGGATVKLTAAGAKNTNGFYSAGEALDPISFSVSLKAASSSGGGGNGGSGSTPGTPGRSGGTTTSPSASATGSPTASASASATTSASASAKASVKPRASVAGSAPASAVPAPSVNGAINGSMPVVNAEPAAADGNPAIAVGLLLLLAAAAAVTATVFFRRRSSVATAGPTQES